MSRWLLRLQVGRNHFSGGLGGVVDSLLKHRRWLAGHHYGLIALIAWALWHRWAVERGNPRCGWRRLLLSGAWVH